MHPSVGFLAGITQHLLRRQRPLSPLWQGRHLRIADSTSLSQLGSTGTDWRIHAVYDLAGGRFTHLELTDGHGGEGLDRGAPVPGELRLGDRGYAIGPALGRYLAQGQAKGADFIIRLRWRGLKLFGAEGQDFDLCAMMRGIAAPGEMSSVLVQAPLGPNWALARTRVIAVRLHEDKVTSPSTAGGEGGAGHSRLVRAERPDVCAEHGLPVAGDPEGPATPQHRQLLLLPLAA